MKRSRVGFLCGIVFVGALTGGCATENSQSMAAASCGNNYTCLTNAAFEYKQQAAMLTALAERYELEAQAKTRELGQDAEQVKRNHELAMQYWSEAQKADELARQYRSELPHNLTH